MNELDQIYVYVIDFEHSWISWLEKFHGTVSCLMTLLVCGWFRTVLSVVPEFDRFFPRPNPTRASSFRSICWRGKKDPSPTSFTESASLCAFLIARHKHSAEEAVRALTQPVQAKHIGIRDHISSMPWWLLPKSSPKRSPRCCLHHHVISSCSRGVRTVRTNMSATSCCDFDHADVKRLRAMRNAARGTRDDNNVYTYMSCSYTNKSITCGVIRSLNLS